MDALRAVLPVNEPDHKTIITTQFEVYNGMINKRPKVSDAHEYGREMVRWNREASPMLSFACTAIS